MLNDHIEKSTAKMKLVFRLKDFPAHELWIGIGYFVT